MLQSFYLHPLKSSLAIPFVGLNGLVHHVVCPWTSMFIRLYHWGEVESFTRMDSNASIHKNNHIFSLFGPIQSCQTGDQPHSDPSPYTWQCFGLPSCTYYSTKTVKLPRCVNAEYLWPMAYYLWPCNAVSDLNLLLMIRRWSFSPELQLRRAVGLLPHEHRRNPARGVCPDQPLPHAHRRHLPRAEWSDHL